MRSLFFLLLLFISEASLSVTFEYIRTGIYIHFDEGGSVLVSPNNLYAKKIFLIEQVDTRQDKDGLIYMFSAITDNGPANFQIQYGTWHISLIANDYDRLWFCNP